MQKTVICDSELIARIRDNDQTAFCVVFERYSGKLYHFSFRILRNKELCKEIVQETFLNLWINRAKLDDQLPISPYLYTITKRLTLNALRSIANSEKAITKLWYTIKQESNETEELVLVDDLHRVTEEVLTGMPKQQQLVYRMSRHQELTYDEIADEMNISRHTVKNHLVAALKTLRVELQKAFFYLF